MQRYKKTYKDYSEIINILCFNPKIHNYPQKSNQRLI